MRKRLAATLFAIVLTGTANGQRPAFSDPEQTIKGQRSADPHTQSETGFDLLLRKASNGDTRSLRTLATLRASSDGAKSEGIDGALSTALETNPEEVLSLMRKQPKLFRPGWLCQDREIEPQPSSVRQYIERANRAVGAVNDPALLTLRDQCLASLHSFG